jgi:hypothetical protein
MKGVVVFDPRLHDLSHLFQGMEQTGIQDIFPKRAVEAFDLGILHRLVRLNVSQLNAVLLSPASQALRDELRAIVHADLPGHSSPLHEHI